MPFGAGVNRGLAAHYFAIDLEATSSRSQRFTRRSAILKVTSPANYFLEGTCPEATGNGSSRVKSITVDRSPEPRTKRERTSRPTPRAEARDLRRCADPRELPPFLRSES